MGNKPLKEKINKIELSNIKLNSFLLDKIKSYQYNWNKKQIEERSAELGLLSFDEIWKL